jgi:hypothetical protein
MDAKTWRPLVAGHCAGALARREHAWTATAPKSADLKMSRINRLPHTTSDTLNPPIWRMRRAWRAESNDLEDRQGDLDLGDASRLTGENPSRSGHRSF